MNCANVLPIIESSLLTGEGLVRNLIQKVDFLINMFLNFKVKHMHSNFCQLHLILSSFVISTVQT